MMKSLALILLCCTLVGVTGCRPPPAAAPLDPPMVKLPAQYEYLTPDQAEKLIASTPGLGILDVRDDQEMHAVAGVIDKARPCSAFAGNQGILQTLDRHQPWLVYCAIGARSEGTAATMAELGFDKVYLLKGGFNAWVAARKPTVKW